ncbi:MAG: phosphoribosylanthranilate isomerase [Halanaerobiaceae bacterium]
MISIKVCGITPKTNVNKLIDIGVDALGFILAESSRQISIKQAKYIINDIPPFISTVAVTVNPEPEQLNKIISSHLFDYIQFHGDEKCSLIKKSPLKNIKAVSISGKEDLKIIEKYKGKDYINFFLFDNKSRSKKGGTGEVFDWTLIKNINIDKPFILAGGLGANNIKEAVQKVKPVAVDLNSCIEKEPGLKDIKLYKETLSHIKKTQNKYHFIS